MRRLAVIAEKKAKKARIFWGSSRFQIFTYHILHSFLSHLFSALHVPDTGVYSDVTFHAVLEFVILGLK